MLDEFDLNRLTYILEAAGTPTPLRRILSDYRKLFGKKGETDIAKQLDAWCKEGKAYRQRSINETEWLYALQK